MFHVTFVSWLLVGAYIFVDAQNSDNRLDNSNQLKPLEKLWHHRPTAHSSDEFCRGSRGRREQQASGYPWPRLAEDGRNDREYAMEYPEPADEQVERLDYNEYTEEDRQPWHKRSASVSPFISLGAFSNLPQFFEQLKGTMDRLDQQQSQQAQMQAAAAAAAAEADRSFRPPATAAVLHAFRNYRPLRRTRSFPPALVQG